MILSLVLWTIAAILAVIGVFICTPVKIRANFNTEDQPPVHFELAALGGILLIPISPDKTEEDSKAERPDKDAEFNVRTHLPHILRALPAFLRRILARLKIESLRGHVKFGLSDPADTGQIFGIIYPLLYRTNNTEKNDVTLTPNFERACLSGTGSFTASVIPVTLLPPIFSFAWASFLKPRFKRR